MTHTNLDELVRQARRDRPAPSLLSSVARNLRVPFVAAPLAALVVPSTATAAALLKAGLGRVTLLGWGAGSAVAASGVAAAVYLSQPAPAPVAPAPARAVPQSVALVAKAAEPAPEPEPPAAPPNAEKRPVKDAVATWDEPQLIERARRALGSDPRQALQLAQEHQRRFPTGALSVEREVIVLDALARSGQSAEALRRARAFEARYPTSIHAPRVRVLRAKLEGS
ncbi:MAG TPA: hypothetical protein VJN18_27300 [Polyangiaceae bacterium]|nr:hypothetical protein [Polyangiaceae bacterium]